MVHIPESAIPSTCETGAPSSAERATGANIAFRPVFRCSQHTSKVCFPKYLHVEFDDQGHVHD